MNVDNFFGYQRQINSDPDGLYQEQENEPQEENESAI